MSLAELKVFLQRISPEKQNEISQQTYLAHKTIWNTLTDEIREALIHADVFTNIGFEKQVGKLFALSIDYIYKKDGNLLSRSDRNQHTYQETQYTDPWLGQTVTIWEQTDSLPTDLYTANSHWAKRYHHFFMLSLKKQEIGKWNIAASFVWQRSRGNMDNTEGDVQGIVTAPDTDPNYYQNPLRWGDLTWNREFQFKCLASVQLPLGFMVSGDFRLMSGNRYEAYMPGYVAELYTIDTVLLEKRGTRKYPWSKDLNLRIAKSFEVGGFSRLEAAVDIFNVFNSNDGRDYFMYPYEVYPISGDPGWGKPRYLSPPRNVRLALRWSF